ncbi:MAG: hypothetical protein CBD18_03360 [Opitutales bacterium TMED158]|nr:MAG: hypothetical protein CBD18_03360 [Opitutales bacterium TMED158]
MKHIENEVGALGRIDSGASASGDVSKNPVPKMPTKLKSLWRRKGRSKLMSATRSNVRWASSLSLGSLN